MKTNFLIYLLLLIGIPCTISAQNRVYRNSDIPKYRKAVSVASLPRISGREKINIDPIKKTRPLKQTHARGTQGITGEVVGITKYDLQTNASVCRRIIRHENNKITTTWTRGLDGSPSFDDRGTGYNYFDGSSWGPDPTERIEAARCGWPEPILTRNGNEMVVSHYAVSSANPNGLNIASRPIEGGGSWTNKWITQVSDTGATWPRMANTGDTIHIIASRLGSSYNNVNSGIAYFRSFNAGLSYTGPVKLPGMDTINFKAAGSIGGDSYAMDSRGNTVVIVAGEDKTILFKSNDAGVTWDTTTILTHSDTIFFSSGDTVLNANRYASDGSFSVALDSNNIAHVFFGGRFSFNRNDTLYFYSWSTLELMYWNENMDKPESINTARIKDDNGDGLITLRDDSIYQNNVTNEIYSPALISMPSAAVGPDGTIYCVYSSIVENTNSTGNDDGELYRNLFAVASHDGGNSWSYPVHITKEEFSGNEYQSIEAVYGSLAKKVDDNLHILYQKDDLPGVAVTKVGETTPKDYDHDFVDNEIRYVTIPTCRFNARFAESDTFICGQGSVQLHASGGTTYRWSHPEFLDDSTSASPTITLGKNVPDDYDNYFVVTVSDSNGCESKAEVGVFLIRAKAGPDVAVCSGEADTIKAVPMLIGNFSWTPTTGLTDTSSFSPLASPGLTTNYILEVNVGSCTDADTVTVRVVDLPAVSFTASKNSGGKNDTITFTNTTTGSPSDYSFKWTFGDGKTDVKNWSTSHAFTNVAAYNVTLSITDTLSGCSNSFTKIISIGLGINENNYPEGVSLNQNKPNPFDEETEFSLSVTEESHVNFYITNLLNQKIIDITKGDFLPGSYQFKISTKEQGLNKGVYLYHLETDNGRISGKMMVQ